MKFDACLPRYQKIALVNYMKFDACLPRYQKIALVNYMKFDACLPRYQKIALVNYMKFDACLPRYQKIALVNYMKFDACLPRYQKIALVNYMKFDACLPRYQKIALVNYMKFDACLPRYQKIALVNCLTIRAVRLCSNDILLNEECDFIREVLRNNGYEKEKQLRMNNGNDPTLKSSAPDSKDEERINVILSYLGHESFSYSRKLMRIFRTFHLNCRIIFKKNRTIGQSFITQMKGRTERRNGVVYRIPCADCNKFYIGQTGKDVEERMKQHSENLKKREPNMSTIVEHAKTLKHNWLFDKPEILTFEPNKKKREIKETLLTQNNRHWALNEISFKTSVF